MKKDATGSDKVGGGKEVGPSGGVKLSENHPDILQGPMKKLKIK